MQVVSIQTDMMAKYLFIESAIDLITEAIGAYLIFLVPASIAADHFNTVGFFTGLSNVFVVLLAFFRFEINSY